MSDRWNRVEELFAAALPLEPAARPAFLEQACPDDAAIRGEVAALLAADAACSAADFLAGSISAAVGDLAGSDAPTRVGQVVGAYRLTGELGHGGMGRVYLAERVDRAYRAEVAIKFVQGGFASAELVSRFRTERQILADLAHPNIARLLDGGATPDGTPFLVMERIAGQPIDRYCEARGLALPARLELFLQVCGAVQHAHQALIVHRDLKPSNIMVTDAGEPKLLDFGIAKLLDPEAGQEDTTMFRALTPAYASPEQVRGARATVATDVYSLGVVLYRLLTGGEPFQLRGLSPGEVERVLAEQEPERPSLAVVRTGLGAWRPLLAGDLDTIVLRTLGKTPAERYPSVADLAADLRRHLDGRPVLARPATFRYRAGKFLRRYRREVALAGGVVVLLLALTGWYLGRLADERDLARTEAAKAAEVAGFLQQVFEVSDPEQARGETVTARELLDRAAGRIETDLASQPAVQATMMRVMGNVYASLGLSEPARALLASSLERHRALYRDPDAETATTELALGLTLQDLGDVQGAEPLIRSAVATRVTLHGPEDRSVTEARRHLAFLLETQGDYPAAESLLVDVVRQSRRQYPPDDPAITVALVKLGGLLRRTGQLEEAEPILREGLAAERRQFGERSLQVASAERNLASLLRDRGAYEEADSLYRSVLATRRALLSGTHPDVINALNSYALLLQQKGDTGGAVRTFREITGLYQQVYLGPHPNLAAAWNNLGFALLDARRHAEAEPAFRRAMAIQDRVLPKDHPNRSHPLAGLGEIRLRTGRYAEATSYFRRSLAIRRAALRPGHREIGKAASDLGAALTGARRFAAAESALVEARQILVASEGPTGTPTTRVDERLEALYQAWGRPDAPPRQRLPLPSTDTGRGRRPTP